jgi:hypothetical protein
MYWALTALLFSRPTGHVHCKGPLIVSPKNWKSRGVTAEKKKAIRHGPRAWWWRTTEARRRRLFGSSHFDSTAQTRPSRRGAHHRLTQMHNIIFASPATIDRQETVLLLGGKSQSPARVFHCTVGAWGKRRTDPWPWVS